MLTETAGCGLTLVHAPTSQVRDARIPVSTGHPMVPSWIGPQKLRLVVLNQMDKISQKEQSRWATFFSTQVNTRVIYTNAKTGEGVPKLFKAATAGAAGFLAPCLPFSVLGPADGTLFVRDCYGKHFTVV